MEYRLVGPSYTLRSLRCLFCNRTIRTSVAISDVLVPSQTDLGATTREYVGKAHNVCIEEKGLEREV